MSSVVISGDTSGSVTLQAPAIAGSSVQTLVSGTGTLAPIVSGTAVTASGTAIDFTGIPSWVKRVTVMFGNISGSGTGTFQIVLNSEVTGYTSSAGRVTPVNFSAGAASTTAWIVTAGNAAASTYSGVATISLLNPSTNQYSICGNMLDNSGGGNLSFFTGTKTTTAVLSTVRVTTSTGTDTFDAGTINIIYE